MLHFAADVCNVVCSESSMRLHVVMLQHVIVMLTATHFRKVLKQIFVGELQPDDTVDAVREARLLAKVTSSSIHRCRAS